MGCATGYLTNVTETGTISFQMEGYSLLLLVEMESAVQDKLQAVSVVILKS